jgi:hypothetical protein
VINEARVPMSMPRDVCPQLGCGETTYSVLVEETEGGSKVMLYPIIGLRWCPKCGVTELRPRAAGIGPARLGLFVKMIYPPRGARVWRVARPGEMTEMMSPPSPERIFYNRVPFVRWDRESTKVVPVENLGSNFWVRPDSVDRSRGSIVPPEIETELNQRDTTLIPERSGKRTPEH